VALWSGWAPWARQPQRHLAHGFDPAQGQITQASGVPTWGRNPSSRLGQGQASPIAMWCSSAQEHVNPRAKCLHVGAQA